MKVPRCKAIKNIAMKQKLIKGHFFSDEPEEPDEPEPDWAGGEYQASPLPLL